MGQGLDESILQGGGVPLSDMAGRVALSAILRLIYTVRCIARLIARSIARSIESNQNAPCKRDDLIARRIGQCIADRPCVLDFWSPDQCLIARLNGHRAISC